MTRLAIAINTQRCIGCQTCVFACKMENNVPMKMRWTRTITKDCDVEDGATGTYPALSRTYLPLSCMHCDNPACQRVCPVGATYTDDKGRVLIHYDLCIGCRICMAACPYNARVFNWSDPEHKPDFATGNKDVPVRYKGIMEKCTLCKERTDNGQEPMCVVCCPERARTYGDLDDPTSDISKLIAEQHAYTLLPEKGTLPKVHYLDGVNNRKGL
jgi:molybdopterin-containing oxidoreductase family iron-sulfur binding subunit